MRPSERDQILRMDFCMLITQFRPRQIVYVDEVGIQLKCLRRRYGYSKETRAIVERSANLQNASGYNMIGALDHTGICTQRITDGTVDAALFEQFVAEDLVPLLGNFFDSEDRSVVVMDNAAVHSVDRVREIIQAAGAELVMLPPYSPDYNAIEGTRLVVRARRRNSSDVMCVLRH